MRKPVQAEQGAHQRHAGAVAQRFVFAFQHVGAVLLDRALRVLRVLGFVHGIRFGQVEQGGGGNADDEGV
jgi:hypothetical protein